MAILISTMMRHNFFSMRAQMQAGGMSLDKWICMICLYVYDPAVGDPDAGIPPGTAFESLPLDYSCPVCGAPKDQFEKLAEYEKSVSA
jgi:rubredoxin